MTTSKSIRSDRTKSGLVVGLAVRIAAPCLAVQKLFQLPVWLSAILNFGNLSSSTNVDQRWQTSASVLVVKSESGVVENMGVEVGIAAPSLTVRKLFPLPA